LARRGGANRRRRSLGAEITFKLLVCSSSLDYHV
jgi:hypothetical protein